MNEGCVSIEKGDKTLSWNLVSRTLIKVGESIKGRNVYL